MLQKIYKLLFYNTIFKFDRTTTIKPNDIAIASVARSDPIMKTTYQIPYTELFNPEFVSTETDFAHIKNYWTLARLKPIPRKSLAAFLLLILTIWHSGLRASRHGVSSNWLR